MVKRLPNWLKIGVQAGFGPNFTMELEAEIRKKIWAGLLLRPLPIFHGPERERMVSNTFLADMKKIVLPIGIELIKRNQTTAL